MDIEMRVSRPSDGTAVVHLPQDVDAEAIRATVRPLIHSERRASLAVDLTAVKDLDTHRLTVLIALSDYLKSHGGALVLANAGAGLFAALRSRGVPQRVPTTGGRALVMTRDVDPLGEDAIAAGTLVFSFTGATWGALTTDQVAVTLGGALGHFIGVPEGAVAEITAP